MSRTPPPIELSRAPHPYTKPKLIAKIAQHAHSHTHSSPPAVDFAAVALATHFLPVDGPPAQIELFVLPGQASPAHITSARTSEATAVFQAAGGKQPESQAAVHAHGCPIISLCGHLSITTQQANCAGPAAASYVPSYVQAHLVPF